MSIYVPANRKVDELQLRVIHPITNTFIDEVDLEQETINSQIALQRLINDGDLVLKVESKVEQPKAKERKNEH